MKVLVSILLAVAAHAEMLSFHSDPRFSVETYRWYLQNSNSGVQTVWSNGVRIQSLETPGGSGTSRGLDALALRGRHPVKVALIDSDPTHAYLSRSTISSVYPEAEVREFVGVASFDSFAEQINAAVVWGANVINFPSGSQSPRESWRAAFSNAQAAGVWVVCAAPDFDTDYDTLFCRVGTNHTPDGVFVVTNCFTNSDFPSCWRLSNTITVSGHDIAERPIFAYSTQFVDLLAPAWRLQGTATSYWHGTSVACAITTGAAALLLSRYPNDDIKARLVAGVDKRQQYALQARSGGSLNVWRSIRPMLGLSGTGIVQRSTDLTTWIDAGTAPMLIPAPDYGSEFWRLLGGTSAQPVMHK